MIDVTAFGATGNGITDDTAAFIAAIAANPGGAIFIPYTPTGYVLTGNVTFGGTGKAKTIIGESYVKLNFTGLSTSTDAVTMNFDTLASISGVTIDMGNSTSVYSNGRDGLRLNGGEWPRVDVQILNAGRDAFHYEPIANGGWLENLRADLRIFNTGRDGIHLNAANFNNIFANEMNFQNVEIRQWKRNAVRAEVNATSYGAAKISNVAFPKLNLDARRLAVDLLSQDVFYFTNTPGALLGGLYDAWTIGNGGIENTVGLMVGHVISPQTGATVRNLKVSGPVILYNIQAPSSDPANRIANFPKLTQPYWIFDTVTGKLKINGSIYP